MGKESTTITSVLVDVTKWSGKTAFGFFVVSLILSAVAINLASPQYGEYTATGEESIYQTFTLEGGKDIQLLFFSESDSEFTLILEQILYDPISDTSNNTYVSQQNPDDQKVYRQIYYITDNDIFRNDHLETGDYRIIVLGDQGENFILGSAHFDIGLLIVAAILFSIFGIAFGIFWTVLPFMIIALIINSFTGKKEQPSERIYNQAAAEQTYQPKISEPKPAKPLFKNTPIDLMTRNDWIGAIFAVTFFILFLIEPDGPFIFFSLIIAGGVIYAISEREKMKDRLMILLSHYPNTSIEFLARQLDKDEKDIIKVLRIMILDNGLPIRLDLINNVVTKTGAFPNESLYTKAVAEPQSDAQKSEIANEKEGSSTIKEDKQARDVKEMNEIQTTTSQKGEIHEPSSYCTGCGEPLLAEVKYCYSCGTRQ